MRLQALLVEARQQLASTLDLPGSEANLEAQILLRETLGGVSRAWLISHEEQALTCEQQTQFETLLSRRLQGEPIAYILGHREFYGLDLSVTPDVLIPRPDTETLVEAALNHIPENQPCRILDLGTGSGAIAIAIALQRPHAMVTALDQSQAAVDITLNNAAQLGANNLRVRQSNWFSALGDEQFEIIVSNPPYIASADPHLKQGDLRFEPIYALASGEDGLDDIRRIIPQAHQHLSAGGWLLVEHGYDQADRVGKLMQEAGFNEVGHARDLAGIRRVTMGRKPGVQCSR
jgi:release factor glutamine methyltransferase